MDESQYLMWMKRKQILKSHLQVAPFGVSNNNNSSWEERAFAEDAARILGGCIWPPRSYSCSFCKREFRSAQALGGHMNVHRRDRARLKQNHSPNNYEAIHHQHHHKDDCKPLGAQFSAEFCSHSQLDFCLNPYNSGLAGTITTSRIACSRPSTMSPYQQMVSSDSEPKGVVINARDKELKGLGCNDYVETSLSVGLNSMSGQKLPTGGSCGDEAISCKRPKTSVSSLPLFLKPCSNDRCLALQPAEFVLGLKPGMEDLDLELRLGKPQKVR